MKIALAIIASVVLGLVAFVGYTEAFGGKTTRYESNYTGADASVFKSDGSTETSVYLSADDSVSRTDDVALETSSLWLDLSIRDVSNPDSSYEQYFWGSVYLASDGFIAENQLAGAQLDVQDVELCGWDYYPDEPDPVPSEPVCMLVDVSADWGDAGFEDRDWGNYHHRGADCSDDYRYENRSRPSSAEISITDAGGNPIFSGPVDSGSAWIYSHQSKGKSRGCDYAVCAGSADATIGVRPLRGPSDARPVAGVTPDAAVKPAAGGC